MQNKTSEEIIAEAQAKDFEEIQPMECTCSSTGCHILYALVVALVVVTLFTLGILLFNENG